MATAEGPIRPVETVVKIGGGVLAYAGHLDAVLGEIASAARERSLLIVPGGGPFADVVRDVDRHYGIPDEAAHWMAVLAMDQYAHLIAARLPGGRIVAGPHEIAVALRDGRVPVLAPSRWLREADPLPHSWDVTSDSIAAWIAGVAGARLLVLVKPPGLRLPKPPDAARLGGPSSDDVDELVDAYFARALPPHVTPLMVPADQVDVLRSALRPRRS